MQISDEQKEKMMDEIIQSIRDSHTQHSYELTTQEFAEKIGRSYGYAKKFLSQQVKSGKMTRRKVTIDGKTFVVYSVI